MYELYYIVIKIIKQRKCDIEFYNLVHIKYLWCLCIIYSIIILHYIITATLYTTNIYKLFQIKEPLLD